MKSRLVCLLVLTLCLLATAPAFAESDGGWEAFSRGESTSTWMNGIPLNLDPGKYETIDFRNYRPIDAETPELGDSSLPTEWLLIGAAMGVGGAVAVHRRRVRL